MYLRYFESGGNKPGDIKMKIIRTIMSFTLSHLWIIRRNALCKERLKRNAKIKEKYFFINLSLIKRI